MADRTRLAAVLWLVFAFVVWNVVFDRVLVLAGRRYVSTAYAAAADGRAYVLVGPWMAAAQDAGLRLATVAGLAILIVGAAGLAVATRRTGK